MDAHLKLKSWIPYNKEDWSEEEYESFLLNYLERDYKDIIMKILIDPNDEDTFSLDVDFMDFSATSQEMGSMLLYFPQHILGIFQKTIDKYQDHRIKEVEGMLDEYPHLSKKTISVRFSSLPVCKEITKETVSSIRSSDIGRLISFQGTVIRTSSPRVLQTEKEFMCKKCKYRFVVSADIEHEMEIERPTRCPNEECRGKAFLETDYQVCRDYQEIKIQDKITYLKIGSIPRSIIVILEGEIVDQAKPGDDVEIIGIVIKRWQPPRIDQKCSIEMTVLGQNLSILNEYKSDFRATKKTKELFDEFWRDHQFDPLRGRNIILKSINPQIYGLFKVKLALLLTLIGGVQRIKDGTKIRGESHLLIVGDPGMGKSQFLKYAGKLSPRHVMTTGIGTSSAGLTVMAAKDSGGEWVLEAGALVLADRGVCCIDEFAAISNHDRATIHEAMEQQTLSIAKAGLICKLSTRCTIIAACNPKGKYDPSTNLSVNTALASPLLSRFDIILVLQDVQNEIWDTDISSHILMGDSKTSQDPEDGNEKLWTFELLKQYLQCIKNIQPRMTREAGKILTLFYKTQRQTSVGSRTTLRLLESLVRIAQAHARLMYRDEVTIQDAIVAITVIDSNRDITEGNRPINHIGFPEDPQKEYDLIQQIIFNEIGYNNSDMISKPGEYEISPTEYERKSPPNSVHSQEVEEAFEERLLNERLLSDSDDEASMGQTQKRILDELSKKKKKLQIVRKEKLLSAKIPNDPLSPTVSEQHRSTTSVKQSIPSQHFSRNQFLSSQHLTDPSQISTKIQNDHSQSAHQHNGSFKQSGHAAPSQHVSRNQFPPSHLTDPSQLVRNPSQAMSGRNNPKNEVDDMLNDLFGNTMAESSDSKKRFLL